MAAEGNIALEGTITPARTNVKVIPAHASVFQDHRGIVEVVCHDRVKTIEREAFADCPSSSQVIMPVVKFIGVRARAFVQVQCEARPDRCRILQAGGNRGRYILCAAI